MNVDGYDLSAGVVFEKAERYRINETYPWHGGLKNLPEPYVFPLAEWASRGAPGPRVNAGPTLHNFPLDSPERAVYNVVKWSPAGPTV